MLNDFVVYAMHKSSQFEDLTAVVATSVAHPLKRTTEVATTTEHTRKGGGGGSPSPLLSQNAARYGATNFTNSISPPVTWLMAAVFCGSPTSLKTT